LQPQPPGKNYRLLKVVTQQATPEQIARLGNDRVPIAKASGKEHGDLKWAGFRCRMAGNGPAASRPVCASLNRGSPAAVIRTRLTVTIFRTVIVAVMLLALRGVTVDRE